LCVGGYLSQERDPALPLCKVIRANGDGYGDNTIIR
jgi:hypothetical protein